MHGRKLPDSPLCAFLEEYVARERLAKIGYSEDFSELDCIRAEAFLIISTEIDKEMEKMAKRKAGKRGGK